MLTALPAVDYLHLLRTLAPVLLPALIWSIVILVLTYFAARWLSLRLRHGLERGGFRSNVAILLSRAFWLTLWIIGLLFVLYELGIGFGPLAALVGVLGLAASLALQTVLQNLVAGVYLLAERPFAIGDVIQVVGPNGLNHEGRVEDIRMRTTHLRNWDDELIQVPNSAIFSGVITNRSAVGGFVRQLTLSFPRDADLEATRAHIGDLLRPLQAVLHSPVPNLRVTNVGEERWTATLSFWSSRADVESEVAWLLAASFPGATVNDGTGA